MSAIPMLASLPVPGGQVRLHPADRIVRLHHGAQPFSSPSPTGTTPAQMRRFYGVDQVNFSGIVGDGTGQTIALVDAYDMPTIRSDLQSFDNFWGLAAPPSFVQLNQNGGTNLPHTDPVGPGSRSWEVEEALDVEWAHVIAPAANLVLVECNSNLLTDLLQGAATAAALPGVVAVSMSFGGGEFPGETTFDSTFTTPNNHPGVTFFASTGDSGSVVEYPAASPNVVAVGGTTLHFAAPDGTYGSETAWSGGGGGTSQFEREPNYQSSVQNSAHRTIPDVSMDADPATGVSVYDSYDFGDSTPWAQFGGTSLGSPMWAALIAIADQGRAASGQPPLDGSSTTLPLLYRFNNDLHDITSGSNGVFAATVGYDRATGLGTPEANLLLDDLSGVSANTNEPAVVGRYIFYHSSLFDAFDTSASRFDDGAIAPDKQALLPGVGPATFANYTSYSKGINGIMVDIANLPGTPTLADFLFNAGSSSNPALWVAAPAPSAMLVSPGDGAQGSTRIEFTWRDGAIRNEWLQVTVKADAAIGLTTPDVFYFGNLVGSSGAAPLNNQFIITAVDEAAPATDLHGFLGPTEIDDPYDYNRDGKVDATDQLIARYDLGVALPVIDPVAPAPSPAPSSLPIAAAPKPSPRKAIAHPRR